MPIILDKSMPFEIKNRIGKYWGKSIVDTFPLTSLPAPLNTHPDIQIHFLSPDFAICVPECFEYYNAVFGKNKFKLLKGSSIPTGTYPGDTAYNVARVGNHIFCNTKYVEPIIAEYYTSHGYIIHHVNQGYAKCNICVANDSTTITEDKGIYRTICKISDIKTLLIEPGSVLIDGYQYGFIGGASGLIDDTVVFTGKITEQISEFLSSCGIKYFEASDLCLKDFGSIIYRR